MTVNVAALNGFHDPVQLSVSGLPTGVTASFSPTTFTPSGISTLFLNAASDAPAVASLNITVTASGGGISHSTQPSLSVNLGLVPLCYGAFSGIVADAETGAPITTASVSIGMTRSAVDSSGRYTFGGLSLGTSNTPVSYPLTSSADTYWSGTSSGTAQCGVVTTVDMKLVRARFSHVLGTVFEGVPDPNDLSESRSITASGTTLAGVVIQEDFRLQVATTGADGKYDVPRASLGYNNAPGQHDYVAVNYGYWAPPARHVTVTAEATEVADFAIVRQCTGTVAVNVIEQSTRQGIPGIGVSLTRASPINTYNTQADAAGQAVFPSVLLGYNNARTAYTVGVATTDARGVDYQRASGGGCRCRSVVTRPASRSK